MSSFGLLRACSLNIIVRGEDIVAYKINKVCKDRERRDFSRIPNSLELKDLLEIQKKSYQWFIEEGIKEVLDEIFPVDNFAGTLSLEITDIRQHRTTITVLLNCIVSLHRYHFVFYESPNTNVCVAIL